jgi:hypothetical protein
VWRDQGLVRDLTKRLCPAFCEDGVVGNLVDAVSSWGYDHGFDIFSHDYEGRQEDEDKALKAASRLILEFLRQHVSDIRGGGGVEVSFRRVCVALGLTELWLALVPFRYHRIHLSAAERAEHAAERAERAAEDAEGAERALGVSHWTAGTIGDWVACATAAAHSPRVDLILISAPEGYKDVLRGIGPELEAAMLCRKMCLKFYERRQCASMPIRCEIEGCPDVDQDEVRAAIRAAIDVKIPPPHSHGFDFRFCGPWVAPELSPEEAAAAAEEYRLEADAEEAVRKMRRARHQRRRRFRVMVTVMLARERYDRGAAPNAFARRLAELPSQLLEMIAAADAARAATP